MNYVGTKYCDDDVITNENSLVQSDVGGKKLSRGKPSRRDRAIYHETEVTGGGVEGG